MKAYIGGCVQAYGAGGHLRQSHHIGKLLGAEQLMVLHQLMIKKRDHGEAAAEGEKAYFGKEQIKLQDIHLPASPRRPSLATCQA